MSQSSLTILLADDEDLKRTTIAQFLMHHFAGAEILHCRSGLEAIEQLTERSADAVITDNSMAPINGIELTSWVRDNLGNVPVIMVSGNPDIEAKAMEAGASAVLSSVRCLEVGIILKRLLEESSR